MSKGLPKILAWWLRRWRRGSGLSDGEALAAISWALRILVTVQVGEPSLESREALIEAGMTFHRSTDYIEKGAKDGP